MNIPIVFSTDHNYVMPAGVAIMTLLDSSKGSNYDIYVLISDDVTEEDKTNLRRQVEIVDDKSSVNFIDMDDSFNKSLEIRGISKACYYRLLIPWLLPDYDKVVYSDVDIIFHDDLGSLYDRDLGNNYVAGVNTPGFSSKKNYIKHIQSLNLDPVHYINSGFLVINSGLQRKDNLKDNYLELSNKKFLFQDQDIINIVCKNRIEFISDRYNTTSEHIESDSSFLSPKDEKKNYDRIPAVIHYTGAKPWKTFTSGWLEWWDCYRKSIFFDYNHYVDVTKKALDRKQIIKGYARTIIEKFIKL